MVDRNYLYLGKFIVNEGSGSQQEVLVIEELGTVRFVGERIDHPGMANTSEAWECDLLFLLPKLGVQVEGLRYRFYDLETVLQRRMASGRARQWLAGLQRC